MNHYRCTPDMHNRCSNNALCHLCDGERLFKDPIAEAKAKREAAEARKQERKQELLKTKEGRKEGMDFERRVQDKWNTAFGGGKQKQKPVSKPRLEVPGEPEPRIDASRDTAGPPRYVRNEATRLGDASGSLWFAKGDIKLHHALLECKERGTVTSKGEKQITIPKDWLDKMVVEAYREARDYWYLPFGYKGDDDVYLIKPYDHEMHLIFELRSAREEIERLQQRIQELERGEMNDYT